VPQNKKQKNKIEARQAYIHFTSIGWEDYTFWQQADAKVLASINTLITEILRTPFKGIGKPEPLKGDLTGYWSRRIDKEHRLVYLYEAATLTVIACRFHSG
jgi:toxin YoeB